MIYFSLLIIFSDLIIVLKYNKIYSDLLLSKKKLENCIKRVDLIQEQMEIFRNSIEEIDIKISKIEEGICNDKF
ncbi:MAG: hypothetical protein IIX47_04435 [Spirochaetaceae bacterium]|nr:hypothetical protein [Spirochaetaceae bacterium]